MLLYPILAILFIFVCLLLYCTLGVIVLFVVGSHSLMVTPPPKPPQFTREDFIWTEIVMMY